MKDSMTIIRGNEGGERGCARQEGLRRGRRKKGGLMQREAEREAGRAGDFNQRRDYLVTGDQWAAGL